MLERWLVRILSLPVLPMALLSASSASAGPRGCQNDVVEAGRKRSAGPAVPFAGWMAHPAAMDAATWSRCLVAASPPPGGLLADPLCGSGTSVCASTLRGLQAIGLESLDAFARAAQAKLIIRRDTAALQLAASHLVEGLEPAATDGEQDLVKRCFENDALAHLVALRDRVAGDQGPWSDHLRVALVSLLRDHACVQVGWPHPQPDRPRTPRSTEPAVAFVAKVRAMANELDDHPAGWSQLGRIERRDARDPLAWRDLASRGSIDAVITSPPYFTGFDYPDALRLETLFSAPEDAGATRRSRTSQIAASASHASARSAIDAHRQLAQWPRTQGSCRALSGALRHRRLATGSSKPYDQLLPMYLRDLGRVLAGLTPLLRPGAALAIVVAHSAPAGVAVPVPRLIERLGEEMGLESEGAETLRARGQRWPTALGRNEGAELSEELVLLRRPPNLQTGQRAVQALAPARAALAPARLVPRGSQALRSVLV